MTRLFLPLTVLMIFGCFIVQAQSKHQTSAAFKQEVTHLKDDTNKVLRYLMFAHGLEIDSPEIVKPIVDEAIAISRRLNYQRGVEECLMVQGELAEGKKE